MPEIIEVEKFRALAEARALHRPIVSVRAGDDWYLKRGATAAMLADLLPGRSFAAARRRGKLMMLDTDGDGPVLGLRFGMTGRLVVDGSPGVDRLQYGRAAVLERFERFAVVFVDGGTLSVSDPRRLGGVELEPDESRLGPDALTLSLSELRTALAGATVALKARLMDQARIAGVGNLIADEVLWRAGVSPVRPAGSLSPAVLRRLYAALTAGLASMTERGGSHTGDLMAERHLGGRCPRDGTPLRRSTVGGRTTWWCPRHQR